MSQCVSCMKMCHDMAKIDSPFAGVRAVLCVVLDLGFGATGAQCGDAAILKEEGDHLAGLADWQHLCQRQAAKCQETPLAPDSDCLQITSKDQGVIYHGRMSFPIPCLHPITGGRQHW